MADIKKIALPDGTSYDIGNLIEISLTWNNNVGTLRNYTNWGDIVNGTHIAGQSTIYFFRYFVGGKSLILFSTSYTSGEFDTIFYSQPDENGYIYKGTVQRSDNTVTINSYTIYPVPGDNGTIQSGDVLTATVLVNPISGNRSFTYNWQTPQSGGASKVKIYYVVTAGNYGQWSGQDFATYNFADAAICEGPTYSSSTTVTTQTIYNQLTNGELVILARRDPDDNLIYCFPTYIGDDNSWMQFTASCYDYNDNQVTLIISMSVDNSYTANGFYSGSLPLVTVADNGKFLRVVNGAWAAATVSNANGVSF